jgi:peptidoglycan/LPS O-acetylase OafA/YrhL
VLLVIGLHAVGIPRSGFVGVDVFFVVSGFVITGRLLSEAKRTGRVSLTRFYGRRIQRVAPAALVVLLAVAAAATVLPQPRRASVDLDTLWAALGLGNMRMILLPVERDGGAAIVSPVVHFWSLAVEEQFYLVWPILFLGAWAVGRRSGASRRWSISLGILASGGSLAIGAWSTEQDAGSSYFATASRGWELGVGILLALLAPRATGIPSLARSVLAVGGLAAIEVSIEFSSQASFPVPGALLPVAGTAALITSGAGGATAVSRFLGSRPLVAIGNRSYSLYLWHFPVFVFALVLQPSGGWAVLIVSATLLGVLAWLSYRFVERPALRLFRGSSEAVARSTASDAEAAHRGRGILERGA